MTKIKKKKRRRKNEDTLLKLSVNKMFLFLFTALLVAGLVTIWGQFYKLPLHLKSPIFADVF